MRRPALTLADIAEAAERLSAADRLLLIERLARSLQRDPAAWVPPRPLPPDEARIALPPSATPPDDDELQELIAETLFEDLG